MTASATHAYEDALTATACSCAILDGSGDHAQPVVTDLLASAAGVEAELARLRPLAEMGRMAATVAHEIRNPLTGISANAELLRESLVDPADVESVDLILGEVARLGHLVSDLLYYCRERPADHKSIDLGWLARTVSELSSPMAASAGVRIAYQGDGRAWGESDLARQALLNVVRNAIQATPRGGRITITVADRRIAVEDTGGGVPEAIRAQLFEPFVTGRSRGLGLGASVAKRCQERQGGAIELLATSAAGSTFVLTWAAH